MKRIWLAVAVLALAGCHPATAPKECSGTIRKGGPFHADTLNLRCR